MLKEKDYHARAAAVEVLRFTTHQVADYALFLTQAAQDENKFDYHKYSFMVIHTLLIIAEAYQPGRSDAHPSGS
jgi:hypothetical protein